MNKIFESSKEHTRRITDASKEELNEPLESKVQSNLDEYFIYKKRFITVIIISIVFYLANLICQYFFGEFTDLISLSTVISEIKNICKGETEVNENCKGKCRMPKFEKFDTIYVEFIFTIIIVLLSIIGINNLKSSTKRVATEVHVKTDTYVTKFKKVTYINGKIPEGDFWKDDKVYEKYDYKRQETKLYETRKQTINDKLLQIKSLIVITFIVIPYQLYVVDSYMVYEINRIFKTIFFYSTEKCFPTGTQNEQFFTNFYNSSIDTFYIWFYYRHVLKVISAILFVILLWLSIKYFGVKILYCSKAKKVSQQQAEDFSNGIVY